MSDQDRPAYPEYPSPAPGQPARATRRLRLEPAGLRIPESGLPGRSTLDRQSARPCLRAVKQVPGVSPATHQPYRLLPTEEIWADDNGHRVLCFVVERAFGDLAASCRTDARRRPAWSVALSTAPSTVPGLEPPAT